MVSDPASPVKRMKRADRRQQILSAATKAFARTGFAATSLDDITAEAGISKVILYRLFESKTDLYRSVLARVGARLDAAVGTDNHTAESIPALLRAAAADPDGFRLLFRYAAREPEFDDHWGVTSAQSTDIALRQLVAVIPDPKWAQWAAHMAPIITIEAVLAWLDAGQPDPDTAADRISATIGALIGAAQRPSEQPGSPH